mmetsp:Transcript_6377/g.19286  ORF Transcript_6377/g.19286 Transcript_6377/m.19286 type:complete len:224 (+) Transcript_6377:441-1112(+)
MFESCRVETSVSTCSTVRSANVITTIRAIVLYASASIAAIVREQTADNTPNTCEQRYKETYYPVRPRTVVNFCSGGLQLVTVWTFHRRRCLWQLRHNNISVLCCVGLTTTLRLVGSIHRRRRDHRWRVLNVRSLVGARSKRPLSFRRNILRRRHVPRCRLSRSRRVRPGVPALLISRRLVSRRLIHLLIRRRSPRLVRATRLRISRSRALSVLVASGLRICPC